MTTRARISKKTSLPSTPDLSALQQVAKETGFNRSTSNKNSRGGEAKTSEKSKVSSGAIDTPPQRGRRKRRVARSENLSHRVTVQTINNLNEIADALSEQQDRDVPLVDALEYAVAQAAASLANTADA